MSSSERPAPPTLVTGAGGFIGSAVTRLLSSQGASVRALLGPPGAQVVAAPDDVPSVLSEIDDLSAVRSFLERAETVVHLAGPASVAASFREPIEYARIHVVGTATMLEACRGSDVRRLVYISSAELYGRPERNPVGEDERPRPRSPYGVAKLAAEALVHALAPDLGIEAVVLRPFSVYGPGSPSRSLVGTLVDQVLRSEAVVLSDLRPVRDYCYVDDVAQAVVRACSRAVTRPVSVYNVGSGIGTSVADLARLALDAVGRDLPIRSGDRDRPTGSDISSLIADVGRIERELGWRAETSLPDGLARTARSLQANEVRHP